ncbi:MAG: TolC family protein [Candidatus Latescibacteria bacterium]|nr:TolC family protein [Candidatus Latescibacterota bacterium]
MAYSTLRFLLYKGNIAGLVFLISLFCTTSAPAQRLLSLQDAIDIALEQSYEMKSLKLTLIEAEENRLAAKYRFRTNADLNLNTPRWAEDMREVPVANALPIYNSLGSMRYQSELNITQPLPTDGWLRLRSQVYQSKESNYFAETDNEIKRKDFLSSVRIWFNQPLFTYNRLKTGLKRAELGYERSSLVLSRSQLDIVYNVSNSFYSLYNSTRSSEISLETFEQQEKQYETASLKYEAGLIPEVEALQLEVNLANARSNVLLAEASLERQKEEFKKLIGLNLDEEIGVKTDIEYTHFDIDLDMAIRKGLVNRTELRENEINIELDRLSIKEIDARNEISANLSAYYDLTGRSDPTLPYGSGTRDLLESSWSDLERRPGNRGVTLTFSLPIWDSGVNKAEVASAKAGLRRIELQHEEEKKTIINSVRDAVRRVQTAESRLQVLQKSQDVAQRAYDISLERFNNGEITSQDLALDNDKLSNAKMSFLGAYISYKLSVEDLKRKTLWDFEKDEPVR